MFLNIACYFKSDEKDLVSIIDYLIHAQIEEIVHSIGNMFITVLLILRYVFLKDCMSMK